MREDGHHASGLLDILALRSAFKHPPLIKHNNANIAPSFIADILWSYSGLWSHADPVKMSFVYFGEMGQLITD